MRLPEHQPASGNAPQSLTRRRALSWLSTLSLVLMPQPDPDHADSLRHPGPESASDQRWAYRVALLRLALLKAGSKLKLRSYEAPMQQGRVLRNIADAGGIDVYWSMTSKEREARLLPIRIPIDRGLLGWRLLLIRRQDVRRFAEVRTLDELRQFRVGQGHDWPDRDILAAAGFSVVPFTAYDGLFQQLARGGIDFLPRAVNEIYPELAANVALDLQIEPSLALHYPAAEYFFVNRRRPDLATLIETGLRRALADGSFEHLFGKYFAANLRAANLAQRHVLQIGNPLLPEATPLRDAALWFNP